jgi:hypothetical protein
MPRTTMGITERTRADRGGEGAGLQRAPPTDRFSGGREAGSAELVSRPSLNFRPPLFTDFSIFQSLEWRFEAIRGRKGSIDGFCCGCCVVGGSDTTTTTTIPRGQIPRS